MKTTDHLRNIGWNGIKCTIPVEFQPSSIGKNHLLFEYDGKPVFEVKWQKSYAALDPGQIIKSLTRESRHFTVPPKLIKPNPASAAGPKTDSDQSYHCFPGGDLSMFKDISPSFTPYPFIWETRETSAGGIILSCSKCKGISILQFLKSKKDRDKAGQIVPGQPDIKYPDDPANIIIKSFQDHNDSPSGLSTWALFDMHAVIPARYQLERYSFQSGHFSMTFKHKKIILNLHRFSPASFLLNKKNLQQFIKSQFSLCLKNFSPGQNFHKSENAVEYIRKDLVSEKKIFSFSLKKIFKRNDLISLCRAWHLPEKNRILAVTIQNRSGLEPDEFNRICNHYNIV